MAVKKPTKAQITHGALHETQAIDLLREIKKGEGTIVLPQVRNGTGHTRSIRTADALVVETWASRGIGFTGVEYKRSRGDWLAELKNPRKAEEIGKYCKYWVILAPAGLINFDEVPELWGLWEIHDNKYIKTRIKAPLRKKFVQPTVEFVCSILRANHDYDPAFGHDWQKEEQIRERIEAQFQTRLDNKTETLNDLKKRIQDFERRTGLNMSWNMDESIKLAPQLLYHLKHPDQVHDALDKARAKLVDTIDAIDKIKGENK